MILFIRRVLNLLCVPLLQSLRRWIKPDSHAPLSNAAVDLTRSKAELVVENAFLRQQLIVLHRHVKRSVLTKRERVLLVWLTGRLRPCKQAVLIVQPDTLPRWHTGCFAVAGDAGRGQRESVADHS